MKRHEKEINEEKKRREKVLSSMVNKTLPKISLIDRNFYLKFLYRYRVGPLDRDMRKLR